MSRVMTRSMTDIPLRLISPLLVGRPRAPRILERKLMVYRHLWLTFLAGFFEPVFYLLSVRIGIATGLVVTGDLVGVGAAQTMTAVGETPNLAARLQALAQPDTIVVSEATQAQLGQMFELADLGLQALKGFAAPVRAWHSSHTRRSKGTGRFCTMIRIRRCTHM